MSHHRKPNWASSLLHSLFLLTPRSPGSDILVVTQTSLGFSSPPNNSNSSKLHLRDISSLQSTAAILVLASLPLDNSHILPAALSAPGSSFTTDPWSSTLPKASCELCFKIFHCPSLPGFQCLENQCFIYFALFLVVSDSRSNPASFLYLHYCVVF